MSFPQSVIDAALRRAGKRCECTRSVCTHHSGRCSQTYGLEAHHITQGGSDTLSRCEILCQKCHENTQSYGRRT